MSKRKKSLAASFKTLAENNSRSSVKEIKQIDIDLIYRDEKQARHFFDETKMKELEQSVREHGIINPIIATKIGSTNQYRIVAGERRYRAAIMAGLKTIPCLVEDLKDDKRDIISLIENIQREDLNPIEEARFLKEICNKFQIKAIDLSLKLGKHKNYVAALTSLLKFSEHIQDLLETNKLEKSKAFLLKAIKDEEQQNIIADKIVNEDLSYSQVNKLIKNLKNKIIADTVKEDIQNQFKEYYDSKIKDIEQILETKIMVHPSKTKDSGSISISYLNKDDFDRIIDFLKKNIE